jgi:hypothetical protein
MSCDSNYYKHSNSRFAPAACWQPLPALIAVCLLVGCAGPNQLAAGARRVSFAELSGAQRGPAVERLARLPAVVHFRRGERVPLELVLDSALAELQAPALALVAKRDFYLLLRADGGPLLSADGVDFEAEQPNWFFFGFAVERAGPTAMRVVLGIRSERQPGVQAASTSTSTTPPRRGR